MPGDLLGCKVEANERPPEPRLVCCDERAKRLVRFRAFEHRIVVGQAAKNFGENFARQIEKCGRLLARIGQRLGAGGGDHADERVDEDRNSLKAEFCFDYACC